MSGAPSRASPRPGFANRLWEGLAVLLLLAVMGGVCGFLAGGTQVFRDEANAIAIASAPTVRAMVDCLVRDGNAPLYPLLLRAWMAAVGHSDVSAQAFSIGWYLAACACLWGWMRQERGPRAGFTLLACILCWSAWYLAAIQVRPYSLVLLVTVVTLWNWVGILQGSRTGWSTVLAFGVGAVATLYTHPWGVFSLTGLVAVTLALRMGQGGPMALLHCPIVRSLPAILLAYSPLLRAQLMQTGEKLAPWSGPAGIESLLATGESLFRSLVPLIVALAVLSGWSWARRAWRRGRILETSGLSFPIAFLGTVPLLVQWAVLTLGAAVVASRFITCWAERYALILTPALLFCLVVWLRKKWDACRGLARAVLAVSLLASGVDCFWVLSPGEFKKSNSREVAQHILRNWRPGDRVVVSCFAYAPSIVHYLTDDVPVAAFPSGERTSITSWVGIERRMQDPAVLSHFTEDLRKRMTPGSRIWLVDPFKSTLLGYLVATDLLPPPRKSHRYNYLEMRHSVDLERWLAARARRVSIVYPTEIHRFYESFTVTLFVADDRVVSLPNDFRGTRQSEPPMPAFPGDE